jgi:preprotein translocase subunit Sec61beta
MLSTTATLFIATINESRGQMLTAFPGLYTDESPGLKVDPVVVLVLSLVFIFSVVALHSMLRTISNINASPLLIPYSYRQDHPPLLQLRNEL